MISPNNKVLLKIIFLIILFNPTISKSNEIPSMSFQDFLFEYADHKGSKVMIKDAALHIWDNPTDKKGSMCDTALCGDGFYIKFDKMSTASYKKFFLSCKNNGVITGGHAGYSDGNFYCGIGDTLVYVNDYYTNMIASVLEVNITER